MPEFKLNNTVLTITGGDIVTAGTEAIVNAANSALSDGAGVTGAIFKAAGPELARYTAKLGGCPTGQARITPSFQIPSPTRFIIHAVGPVYDDYDPREAASLLYNTYSASLELAAVNGIKSIAFPAISTGIYGFPVKMATAFALRAVLTFLKDSPHNIEEVRFVVWGDQNLSLYRLELTQLLSLLPSEITGDDSIYFYNKDEPYYEFTNFAPFGFFADDTYWKTGEHYFQAQKFPKMALYEQIRQANFPSEARKLARDNFRRQRDGWDDLRLDVMRKALRLKFDANPPLKQMLLSTGQKPLVEASDTDNFWGYGPDHQGENNLGKLLMELRDQYHAESGEPPKALGGA